MLTGQQNEEASLSFICLNMSHVFNHFLDALWSWTGISPPFAGYSLLQRGPQYEEARDVPLGSTLLLFLQRVLTQRCLEIPSQSFLLSIYTL